MSVNEKKTAKDEILAAAAELFNEHGTASISTNHIAKQANISIGNLYYHFKNKEEIIRALYALIVKETGKTLELQPNTKFTADDLNSMLAKRLKSIWKYRFFRRELVSLCQNDPVLAEEYKRGREIGVLNTAGVILGFSRNGVISPNISPEEADRLAQAIWLVNEFYPAYVECGGEKWGESHLRESQLIIQRILRGAFASNSDDTQNELDYSLGLTAGSAAS